jgi:hypothetical protein
MIMRTIISTVLAISVLAGIASASANAASASQKGKHYPSRQSTSGDWYPHDASQLPFGSQRWWDQKESEGSAGR